MKTGRQAAVSQKSLKCFLQSLYVPLRLEIVVGSVTSTTSNHSKRKTEGRKKLSFSR